ncbi:MAG: hypothetical protein QOI71_1474 [Gaiellales bacterium]|nr:hypothetical protein [Gaiellales bacterium]
MHLLFVDESGQLDQGGFFALGGIAVRDSDCVDLRERWQDALTAQRWPLDKEVKWHGIRSGAVPPALADALFAMLAAAPVTAFVTMLDQQAGRESYPEHFATAEDTYSTGLMFLAERFHRLLETEDDLGLIVVDSRFREEDARLRRFFAELTKDGTPFMQLPRIIEGLFLGPSHYSIGLQCADLVVAMTANAERGPGIGRGYMKKLMPRYAVHPATGEYDGVGIKRFPEKVKREPGRHRLF